MNGRVIPFRRPAGDAAPPPAPSGQMSTLGLIGVAAAVWIGWEVLKVWAMGDEDMGHLPRQRSRISRR